MMKPAAKSNARSRTLRAAIVLAGSAVGLTALIGVLHLPIAAPLLRTIFPGSICPVTRGTPEQIDRAHALGAAAIRRSASAPAPAQPALGFALEKTRRSELDAWAALHGASCTAIGGNDNLQRCTGVRPAAIGQPGDLGSPEEVTFEFRSTGELVDVQTMRRHLSSAQAAHTVRSLEADAVATLGPPTTEAGQPTDGHLGRSFMSTYVAVHTFSDYRATISATNLADTGVMVREEYLSVR
jgi:hypothetical protein